MKKLLALTSLALLSSTVFAADSGIDYNEVSIGYASLEASPNTSSGYGIGGNFLFTENIFVNGSYFSVSKSSTTLTKTTGSLGYRMPIASNTDALVTLGYTNSSGGTLTQDTYPMSLGVRAAVSPEVDLGANVLYISDTAKNQSGFSGVAKYKMSNNLFISGEYRSLTDTKFYIIGVGFKF